MLQGSVMFVYYCRNSFGGRDPRPPPSRRDRSSSAERNGDRDASAAGPNAPPSLLDLPKIPPPAGQEGGSDRNPHATDSHQGATGPRFQSPRGPPGPGKIIIRYPETMNKQYSRLLLLLFFFFSSSSPSPLLLLLLFLLWFLFFCCLLCLWSTKKSFLCPTSAYFLQYVSSCTSSLFLGFLSSHSPFPPPSY